MAQSKPPRAPERPLSPHVQIWRWHLTMATSILHRITGVGNALGMVLLTAWLLAAASGPDIYAFFQGIMSTWLGQGILFGFTLSLSYHFMNGIRHLVWDTGHGYGLGTARFSGMLVFLGTIALALGVWAAGYPMGNGANLGGTP